ncbi:hypothetical protein [Dickeya zeae]|uniref:hypothetical protein n=1 Tax=Dickeya zeae TaxID=204042 RepID=UPI001CF2FA97|nr:hypothetical protein [Dickeya zeae]MCA6987329.1 hypothetical protein [Dickeya zeae]
METLKFAALSRALSLQGEDLLFKTKFLLNRVNNYWGKSKTLNSLITFDVANDELEIQIPQCKFHCFSETKISFIGNKPISEVCFYTKKNDENVPFVVFHIDTDNIMTIPGREEAPKIDLDYAQNVENHFMDELVEAALKAQLF